MVIFILIKHFTELNIWDMSLLDFAEAVYITCLVVGLLSPFILLYVFRKGTLEGDKLRKAIRRERKKYWTKK